MTQFIPLTLESLGEIDDGSVGLLVRNALVTLARDCLNRPTDKTKRKLILELTMVPVANGTDLKHIEFLPEVRTKMPSYHTAPMVIRAANNGFSYSPRGNRRSRNRQRLIPINVCFFTRSLFERLSC